MLRNIDLNQVVLSSRHESTWLLIDSPLQVQQKILSLMREKRMLEEQVGFADAMCYKIHIFQMLFT